MFQRTALFIASLVAALVLSVGLVLAGSGPAATSDAPLSVEPAATTSDALPEPTVQVDTIYVTPKAKPAVITVRQPTRARSEGDDEHEGSDD